MSNWRKLDEKQNGAAAPRFVLAVEEKILTRISQMNADSLDLSFSRKRGPRGVRHNLQLAGPGSAKNQKKSAFICEIRVRFLDLFLIQHRTHLR